ncbi:ABC transporter substrate-binding protein [Paenibacillus sp. NAIST15-1]|uniref:ABC transporter substrate-binding protein n=1 Tax=Paenibacillus sp. NAIST15-1 TaxID=1605994 RepID=UPI0009340D8C|nr:extracellular solute-binding protein [Paenibacillus sp. NAIST15-1]
MEKKKYVQRLRFAVILVLILSFIGGCLGKKEVLEPLEPLQPSKIKLVYQDEEAFYHDYGKYFSMKYPQIEVEVIPEVQVLKNLGKMIRADEYEAEVKKLLEKADVDVYMLDSGMFEQFAADGKLYDIGEVIGQDGYNVEEFMPGLIDSIKNLGNGKLYGLTPQVSVRALYYNTKLFKENQIDPPTNKMTWQEVLHLASRFTNVKQGNDPVHGMYYSYGDAGTVMFDIADSSGLKLFDPKGKKVLINSDSWKKAIKLATDAVRSEAVYFAPEEQIYPSENDFYNGQAAMTIGTTPITGFVRNNDVPVDWEVVTFPIEPGYESIGVSLYSLFAVSANSPNKRAAWEFVKFTSGPEMAHARSRTMSGAMPSRTGYLKEFKGKSMEAFYMLNVKNRDSIGGNVSESEFYRLFNKTLEGELQAVIDNKKSVDEAAAALEIKGQEILSKLQEESKKKAIGSSKEAHK